MLANIKESSLARYLIDHDLSRAEQMSFDDKDRITSWGLNSTQLDEIINSGKPFQTSGCLGKTMEGACNRPFGDGPPSDIRSFPFELNEEDIALVKNQMKKSDD
jgi:biotin synthase